MKRYSFVPMVLALVLVACGPAAALPTPAPPTATPQPTNPPHATATPPPPTLEPTPLPPTPAATDRDLVAKILFGDDGVQSHPALERWGAAILGPAAALAVAPDGSFWVADSRQPTDPIGTRLLHFSPIGDRLDTIALNGQAICACDLEAAESALLVLDQASEPPTVIRLTPRGELLARYQLPAGLRAEAGLTGIALGEHGEVLVEQDGGTAVSQLVDASGQAARTSLPGYPYYGRLYTTRTPDLFASDRSRGSIAAGATQIEVSVPNELDGLHLLKVNPDGSFYVVVEELLPNLPHPLDQTVRHYAADGTLLGMARVPLAEQLTNYLAHSLAIGPDGALYVLIIQPVYAEIRRLPFTRELKPILPNKLTTYTDPDGQWSVQYLSSLLHVEQLGEGVVLFISQDRHTFAAVDSFVAPGDAFGKSGEGLRTRARATLARIYGRPVNQIEEQIEEFALPGTRWEIGIGFTTERGSHGGALYEQRGRDRGDFRVTGFLYGAKADDASVLPPLLAAMRDTFTVKATSAGGPASSTHISDLDRAREALTAYAALLHARRYSEAIQYYGGSYEVLSGGNPDTPPTEYARLFEQACTGLDICLRIRSIVHAEAVSPTEFRFMVEFMYDDGTIFTLGPCCGATEGPTRTHWPYPVKKVNDTFLVQETPPYVP
jgi:hypothetical protein